MASTLQFAIKQNDTAPNLDATLSNARKRPRILTGATVVFHMRLQSDLTVKITSGACTIDDPSLGICHYPWSASDTDTAGIYEGEFQVTYSDATVETFPNSDYIIITITDDIV